MGRRNRIHIFSGINAAVILFLLSACKTTSTGDVVLDDFKGDVKTLSPVQTIPLESYDILMPSDVIKYGDNYVVFKGQGGNFVNIITPSTGRAIHCFKKGRGPGEIVTASSFQVEGDSLYIYDISMQRYYSLDLREAIAGNNPTPKVRHQFKASRENGQPLRPFVLYKTGTDFLSTGIFPEDAWYCLADKDYNYLDGVDYLDYDVIRTFARNDVKHTFHISSLFSGNPDGERYVCAFVSAAAFSLFKREGSSISEYYRYVADRDPGAWSPGAEMGNLAIAWKTESIASYYGVCSDKENIYMLYSGKQRGDTRSASYLCSHLLVYGWDGRPKKRYELEKEVSSIHFEKGKLYCVTSYPEPEILVYSL